MSLPVDAAAVKAAAPEFADVSNTVIEDYIAMADTEIDEDAWGSRAERAEVCLTAHLMTVYGVNAAAGSGGGGAAGPISTATVGEVSVSYAATATLAVQLQGLDPSLALSRYGLEYARLIKLASQGMALADV